MEKRREDEPGPGAPVPPPGHEDEELGPHQGEHAFVEGARLEESGGPRAELSREVLGISAAAGAPPDAARLNRDAVHVLGATFGAVAFLAAAGASHFLRGPLPSGSPTFMLLGATLLLGYAALLFGTATWPRARTGALQGLEVRAHKQRLLLVGLAIGLACALAVLAMVEFAALLVAVSAVSLDSGASLFFARHYPLFVVVVLGLVAASVLVRARVPALRSSKEEEAFRARWTKWRTPVVIALLAVAQLSVFLALGIDALERLSHVHPRQAVYTATLAVVLLLVYAPLEVRLPNLVALIQEEVRRSRSLTRPAAERMQRTMVRNYVLALLFVLLSVAFLAVVATGILPVQRTHAADLILLVYVVAGLAMLVLLGLRFAQHRNVERKLGRAKKGEVIAKRRYTKDEVTRMAVIGASVSLSSIFGVLGLLVAMDVLSSVERTYATDLFIFALLSGLGPYGWYQAREMKRVKAIDEKFPDFMRDLAEGQRAGMTLPRSLMTASKGTYGALTPEIRRMAAQVEWGIPFTEAFQRFAKRVRTPLIERSVSLVVEASNSGGNVVDVLSAASDDAREIKNILWERRSAMGIYAMIIYIAFAVFLVVIGVLNAQFIPELARATSQVAGQKLGGLDFSAFSVASYQRLFFHAAILQGLGGGFVAGVMTQGKPLAGLKHSFIMVGLAYVVFRFLIL